MDRIEVNVLTGERKVIALTPEEVADAQARTAEEAAQIPFVNLREKAIDALLQQSALSLDAPQAVKDYIGNEKDVVLK